MIASNTNWAWPWWSIVVSINAIQLVVCLILARRVLNQSDDASRAYVKRMVVMGLIFTGVAAYRSVFVSRYFSQMAWFDCVANSSLIIRTFAVFAEISFAGLFASAMLRLNKELPFENQAQGNVAQSFAEKSPYLLVACIFIAQFFAYGGLILKSSVSFAIEETLWSLGFISILPLAFIQLRRVLGIQDPAVASQIRALRGSAILIFSWCVVYCCYGLFCHLPLESWPGALEQLRTGVPEYKAGFAAVKDSLFMVNESKEYSDWGFGFLFWHSAYFTICVWIAISLMRAPRMFVVETSGP
jgi:hypothetical protein